MEAPPWVKAPDDKLLQAVFLCLLCAVLSFPLGLDSGARFIDGLVMEGTAKHLQNLCLLCPVYFLGCFFIHSAADRDAARRQAHRETIPLGVTALVITMAMAATPEPERSHTYTTADMEITGVAVCYPAAGLYLTYALAVALFWTVCHARLSSRPLVIGLWMVAVSLAAMVLVSSQAVPVALPSEDGLHGDVRQLALLSDAL